MTFKYQIYVIASGLPNHISNRINRDLFKNLFNEGGKMGKNVFNDR